MKRILFICKHNIFRSRLAEFLFNKMSTNKNYVASSAGIIKWYKEDLKGDVGYEIEQRALKKRGIFFEVNSKVVDSSTLKKTDIVIVVADDVSPKIFRTEKAFNGKVIVWKVRDVRHKDKDKKKVAEETIQRINQRVSEFVKKLK